MISDDGQPDAVGVIDCVTEYVVALASAGRVAVYVEPLLDSVPLESTVPFDAVMETAGNCAGTVPNPLGMLASVNTIVSPPVVTPVAPFAGVVSVNR